MSTELCPAGPGDELSQLVAERAARVAAMPALPPDDGSRYSVRRLTLAWLIEAESVHTRAAHLRDLQAYLGWCDRDRLDPLTAWPTDLGQFRVWRELQGTGGRTAAASTVARALASVSSWYTHLVANSDGRIARNPVAATKRPKVNTHTSTTVGLTDPEIDLLLVQAAAEVDERAARLQTTPDSRQAQARYLAALRDRALLRLLADLGLRISEALGRDLDDLSYKAGHRTLRYLGKGAQLRERAVPPPTQRALDAYFNARAAAGTAIDTMSGPMFATRGPNGEGQLAELNVFTWLRDLAAAASLPAATHRYDRDRFNLDRDPGYVVSAARTDPRAPEADDRREPGQIKPMTLQEDNAG